MITALDSSGGVSFSLMQSNTNTNTMQLFLTQLINKLDDKDKYWRKSHILMCDGASYHTSEHMLQFYKDQRLPILITGPYSYSGSPVELFFAAFKRDDVNPRSLPTGKQ